MKNWIILSGIVFFCCTCNKKNIEGDLSGDGHIRGRLFLYDSLTQQANGIPQAKKRVTLNYATAADTLNYIFSTVTDDEGYFLFTNLRTNIAYVVSHEDTTNGVIYRASTITNASTDTLRLISSVKLSGQNGLHLTVTDTAGNTLSNVNLCLFNSPFAFGFLNSNCDGSNYTLQSDANVHAYKFSIPQGSYYVNSSLNLSGLPLFSKDTFKVGSNIVFDTVKLKIPNGMHFTLYDSLGTRLSGASICVFTSLALYQQDTCAGSNFQLISGINGEVSRYSLAPNNYYIYCSYSSPGYNWVARDTMLITDKILNHSLILRHK